MSPRIAIRQLLNSLFGLILILGMSGGTAFAQSSEEEQRFIEGVNAFSIGDYPQAVRHFQLVYNGNKQPVLAHNIALGFERMGDLASSIQWYQRYRGFNPPDALAVESKIVKLQLEVGALPLGGASQSAGTPQGLKPAAFGVGVAGVLTASVLGSMAMYYSGRSEETGSRKRQGIYSRDAQGYALATDVTLLLSLAGLAYGGTLFLDPPSAAASAK